MYEQRGLVHVFMPRRDYTRSRSPHQMCRHRHVRHGQRLSRQRSVRRPEAMPVPRAQHRQ